MARSEMLRAGLDSGSRSAGARLLELYDQLSPPPASPTDWASGLEPLLTNRSASFRAAAATMLIALVAACSPPPPVAVPPVVAPLPKVYTCQEQRRLANEFAAMPAGSMARQAIQDYGQERGELRAVHGLPKPAACP